MPSAPAPVHHPVFARVFGRLAAAGERSGLADVRERVLADTAGRVLEVGAGSGANFAHYPAAVTQVVAVDGSRSPCPPAEAGAAGQLRQQLVQLEPGLLGAAEVAEVRCLGDVVLQVRHPPPVLRLGGLVDHRAGVGALDRGSHQLGRRHLDVRPPDQDGQVGHPLGVRCPGRAAGEGDHPERTFASAYDTDDVPYRLLTMLQMVGVLVLAAGVPVAVEHADYRAITVG